MGRSVSSVILSNMALKTLYQLGEEREKAKVFLVILILISALQSTYIIVNNSSIILDILNTVYPEKVWGRFKSTTKGGDFFILTILPSIFAYSFYKARLYKAQIIASIILFILCRFFIYALLGI